MVAGNENRDAIGPIGTGESQQSALAVLWGFARPHSKVLLFALFLGFLVSAMDLASPLVTRWVLESLGDGAQLLTPVLILVGLLVVGTLVSWLQWVVLGTVAEHVVFDARESMIRRFLAARIMPLLRRPAGELVTRVTSDSVLLREAASSSVVGLINGLIMLVGTLVMMAVLDLVLVFATVGAVIVVVLAFVFLMPAIARAQERSQAALGSLGGTLEGTLRAIKTVKVAGAESRQTDLLLQHAQESRAQSIRAVRREALVWSIAWSGIQAAIIVILGVGAWRVSLGEMSVPTLVAFLLYAFGLLGPIMELSTNLTTLQAGIAAANRIREVDAIEVETDNYVTTDRHFDETAPIIELDHVTARYTPGADPAVREVSLRIPARGHTAIVGPSGAGKTSILSLILRFLDPESGQLLLGGVPYEQLGSARVRAHLAYVEQETPTLPGTLRDNLTFANEDATEADIHQVLRQIKLDSMVTALPEGLDTPLSDTAISGGQRQRIALARALLVRPAVLLLDEATAQVDGISEAAIHDTIREQARRGAVVTIAHRLSTVVDAETIVVMDEGQIVARGSHQELLASSELYRRLVEALRLAEATTSP